MSVQRKLRRVIVKRLKADNIKKNERIGELLGLEPIPVHHLAYKEERLDRSDGDCYPLVDVLERMAVLLESHVLFEKEKPTEKTEYNHIEIVEGDEIPKTISGRLCVCGFVAKSHAGLVAHQRKCDKARDE